MRDLAVGFADPGRTMERVARAALLMRCRAAPVPVPAAEALPFLRHTALADALVSGLRFKALQQRVRQDNAADIFGGLLSVASEQLPLLVEFLPKSRSPDLVVLLGRHVLGVQVKNYGQRSTTTWAEVREEAAKSRPLVDAQARRLVAATTSCWLLLPPMWPPMSFAAPRWSSVVCRSWCSARRT